MIAVVFRANHFVERNFRGAVVAPVALDRVPRHREDAGILDADIDFEPVVAVDQLEAARKSLEPRGLAEPIMPDGIVLPFPTAGGT